MGTYTDSELLYAARRHEALFSDNIPASERPQLHLPARIGWMNDPNGFSYFDGHYHLFYQYYPYDSKWGPMHWGHAVSDDLVHWEMLPAAMAPDQPYDGQGCFSGSALDLGDGRHLLMYTGVREVGKNLDGSVNLQQTQCLAVGDGLDYVKYDGNPVISSDMLPEGFNPEHFRDPKIWRGDDGVYHAVMGARTYEGDGSILQYRSADLLHWEFECVLATNGGRYGTMWECPDTFELDGKQVLLVSPQDMLAESNEFISGNGTLAILGHLDPETGTLIEEHHQSVDYGIDFYATQTLLTPDGRRVMVGWMQNWDTISMGNDLPWFGQITLPRELSIRNGRLCQWPVRELDAARSNRVAYEGIELDHEVLSLDGVKGRCVDLSVTVRCADEADPYREFALWFAGDEHFHSSIRFRPYDRVLKINRKHSGLRRAVVYHRKCVVHDYDGTLRLRIIIDRFSVEVFVGQGEQTMTMCIPTDGSADGISFFSDGHAVIDVEKFDLA